MNRNLFIRLAFAAHRVADSLPQEEVKQEIKESANTILADLILFAEKDGISSERRKYLVPQLMRQIDILLVYLDKAKREGWMNAENFSILEIEYARIKSFLELFEDIQEPVVSHVAKVEENRVPEQREKKEKAMSGQASSVGSSKKEKSDLSERQRKILMFLRTKNTAQVWELQKVLPQVTKRTLRRDLDGLLQLKLVERKGEWNTVVYELKEKEVAA